MNLFGTFLTLGSAIAMATYMFYGFAQLPRDLHESDKLFDSYVKRKVVRILSNAAYSLGLGEVIPTGRYLHTTSFLSLSKPSNLSGVTTSDEIFDGVPVRIYRPDNLVTNGPAFVWIHGGGWVWGSVTGDDDLVAEMGRRLGILMVSIDYGLAPEDPFPRAIDDCAKASAYFLDNAEKFGVNPSRIAIGGASAGGNLAAAVSVKFRNEERRRRFALQVHVVPCLQALDFNTPAYQQNENDGFLPKSWMINYWLWYALGFDGHTLQSAAYDNSHVPSDVKKTYYSKLISHDLVSKKYHPNPYKPQDLSRGQAKVWDKLKDVFLNPYFAPLMSKDFKGVPPAYIITADLDVLRDDGIMYAKRLEKDGVPVVHKHYDNLYHATIANYKVLKLGKQSMDDLVNYLIRKM